MWVSFFSLYLSLLFPPKFYLSCVTHTPHSNSISPQFVGGIQMLSPFSRLVLLVLFWQGVACFVFLSPSFCKKKIKSQRKLIVRLPSSSGFHQIASITNENKNCCEIRQLSRRETVLSNSLTCKYILLNEGRRRRRNGKNGRRNLFSIF